MPPADGCRCGSSRRRAPCAAAGPGNWARMPSSAPAGTWSTCAPTPVATARVRSAAGARRADWLERWQQRLLPTTHFHVIFTLPEALHPLWRWNRRRMADAFFRAASDALLHLLEQPRHLGARPGILMGLHTWGGALPLHPHLHCLVTAGGVDADGRWRSSRPNFLLWAPILRDVFRATLVAALEQLLPARATCGSRPISTTSRCGRCSTTSRSGRGTCASSRRTRTAAGWWCTWPATCAAGRSRTTACSASRDGRVAFSAKQPRPAGRAKWRRTSLAVDEFLDRLFEHVRRGGCTWCAATACTRPGARGPRVLSLPDRAALAPAAARTRRTAADAERCPRCGAPLTPSSWPRPDRGPGPMKSPQAPVRRRVACSTSAFEPSTRLCHTRHP